MSMSDNESMLISCFFLEKSAGGRKLHCHHLRAGIKTSTSKPQNERPLFDIELYYIVESELLKNTQ